MTDQNKDIMDISGMEYEEAITYLKKITTWTDSQIITYVTIVQGIEDSDAVEVNA